MASTQEFEMLRRQLDELTAQMIEMRQQSSSTAMNAAVSGLAEAVRTMGLSVSKLRQDMRVGKPEPYAPGKDFDDWDSYILWTRGYARSCLSCIAENSKTITKSGDGDSTTRTAVCNIAVPTHYTERSTESGEKKLETTVSELTDNCA